MFLNEECVLVLKLVDEYVICARENWMLRDNCEVTSSLRILIVCCAVTVVGVVVVLIASGWTVLTVPSFSVCCPANEGDDRGSKLLAILGELILHTRWDLVEVVTGDESTLLESVQGVG